MARAGYDIDAAAPIWRRMGATAANVGNLETATTHPTSAERFLRLEKSTAEIKAKIAAGKPLTPEFETEAPWLRKRPSEDEPDTESPSS
jgi:predicted Zn-dependent protease